MKGFLRFAGFLETLGGIALFIIFCFELKNTFDWYYFIGSIVLFINGAFYFYLGDLGYKVESLENVSKYDDGQIELLNRRKVADRVDELEKRLNKLEGIEEKTIVDEEPKEMVEESKNEK